MFIVDSRGENTSNAWQPFRSSFSDPLSADNILCPVEFSSPGPPIGALGRETFVGSEVEGGFDEGYIFDWFGFDTLLGVAQGPADLERLLEFPEGTLSQPKGRLVVDDMNLNEGASKEQFPR